MSKKECKEFDVREMAKNAPGTSCLLRAGMIPQAGSSTYYNTGTWRTYRPIHDKSKCINCLMCWIYCPDCSILLDAEGKVTGIDYVHCKGCGLCAFECPAKVKAITMKLETECQD